MLTQKQIKEIGQHLEKAQNPVFFFDNDQDGLCSFLLLQRYIHRGRGVAIKSFPEMDSSYFRKVNELNADYIFILDKPLISKGFFDEVEKVNIPVVWIDHHEVQIKEVPDFVSYFNPVYNKKKTNEPVTALCYQVTKRKEDLWLAIIGCISDKFLPDFYPDLIKQFPELTLDSENAFDIFYKSEIGKIARIFGFGLKDKTTNVVNMMKFLMRAKSPYDILEKNPQNKQFHERFDYLNKRYSKLLKKAIGLNRPNEKILFFEYGGDLSISADISNELSYKFPEKFIVVGYVSGAKLNISIRGKNAKDCALKAIENLEGARGGGHDEAVGIQIKVEDLEKFKRNMIDMCE